MPAISSTSASASSSRMSSPAPPSGTGPIQPIDPYRTLSAQVKKPLIPLLPSSSSSGIPNLPTLLSLDPITYSSRLSGKTLQISDPTSASTASNALPGGSSISPLVRGKKRNRGNPIELEKVRKEHQLKDTEKKELGLYGNGLRKVRRRLGGVMGKGMKISYESLIPLNHLHTNYLLQLLSLPSIPTPIPSIPTPIPSIPSFTGITINPDTLLSKMSKADFTGMIISVTSSKNNSLIGIKGIVIEETCSTFRIVTQEEDKVKVIPKVNSLFRLQVPAYSPPRRKSTDSQGGPEPLDMEKFQSDCPTLQIDLLGSNFLNRSGDRAGKKLKPIQGNGGGSGWSQSWIKGTDWDRTFDLLSDQLGESPQIHEDVQQAKKKKQKTSSSSKKRKRNKSRRKDPPAFGNPG